MKLLEKFKCVKKKSGVFHRTQLSRFELCDAWMVRKVELFARGRVSRWIRLGAIFGERMIYGDLRSLRLEKSTENQKQRKKYKKCR